MDRPALKVTPYHASRHLEEDALTPELQTCPVCGYEGDRAAVCGVQRLPDVVMKRCPRCHACSVSRMPTDAALDHYYGHYYGQQQTDKITFTGLDRFARRLVKAIDLASLPERVRVLDFGGGDGSLALRVAALLDRPVHLVVADYETPKASDDERITIEGVPRLEQVEGAFDLIIASAILEHIPRLSDTLPELFSHLAPGGWFYARTPWMTPMARVFKNLDLTFPAHVHDLGAGFWNRLPQTLGLPLLHARSRPSIVETGLMQHPLRTSAAWLLKLPATLQVMRANPKPVTPIWRFVGGWEVVLQRDPLQ